MLSVGRNSAARRSRITTTAALAGISLLASLGIGMVGGSLPASAGGIATWSGNSEITAVEGGTFAAVNCTSPGNCVAVGGDLSGTDGEPIYAAESGGVWGPATEIASADGGALYDVSCASVGNCVAVGSDSDGTDGEPIYTTESGGVWGPATVITATGGGVFYGVSCTSAGNCTAVGNNSATAAGEPIYASEVGGVWGPATQLTAFDDGGSFSEVSCPSAGDCVAVGIDADGLTVPMYATESAGTWGPATNYGESDGDFYGVSCTSVGNCTVVGLGDGPDHVTVSGGVWGSEMSISGTRMGLFYQVSCSDPTDCTAVGQSSFGANMEPIYDTETGGVWGASVTEVAATGGGQYAGVSCQSPGNCTVVGNDNFATVREPIYASSVTTQSQAITFSAPASGAVGGSATLSATGGGSNNPVTFSVDSSSGAGVCDVSGTNGATVNYTAVGSCVVDANQAGSDGYTAAPQVQQTITVGQGTPTTPAISDLPSVGYLGGGFTATVSTTGDGTESVTSSTPSVCTASGLTVTYVGTGTCTLTAQVTSGVDYLAATGTPQSLTVDGFTITTTSLPSASPGTPYTGAPTLQVAGEGLSTPPYVTTLKWKKVSLPKGLVLSRSGVLSGTPKNTLTVNPSGTITVKATETVITVNGKKKAKASTSVEAVISLPVT